MRRHTLWFTIICDRPLIPGWNTQTCSYWIESQQTHYNHYVKYVNNTTYVLQPHILCSWFCHTQECDIFVA